ncbi:MAG: hypothetical protein GF344_05825 [Chitinivibrionales bacterium]|nr:hypothetical protein [Chitinivibrionales bacterium]
MLRTLCALALFFSLCGGAETSTNRAVDTLSGELPLHIANPGHPYLVIADISVRPGETVVVEPGTVFLFKNFTGLQIHGALRAEGAEGKPIVFTSENDSFHSPVSTMAAAPYDWNGITVFENAVGTTFEHCRIEYSLYGINSLTDQVIIRECRFHQNARSDLSIKGKGINVGEKLFSNELGARAQPRTTPPHPESDKTKNNGRIIALRIGCAAVSLAGVGYGIYKTRHYRDSQAALERLSDPTTEQKATPGIIDKWEKAKDTRDRDRLLMALGYIGGGLGLVGFTISFTF